MRWYILAMVLSLLPLIAFGQSGTTERWSVLAFVHPDSRMLIGLDWRRIIQSPLGPAIGRQVHLGGHPLLGFLDSIENIDRLMVSSPGVSEGGRQSLLVAAEGRFQLARIRSMAMADGAVSKRYNDVELMVSPGAGNADLHFALLNGQTVLFGDGMSVKSAIDRWQRGDDSYERNQLVSRSAAVAGVRSVWAMVENPAETLPNLGFGNSTLSAQLESIDLGINLTDSLTATLTLKASTEEGAQTLALGLPALLQLAAITYSEQPSLAQLAQRLKVTNEKGYVKMGVTLDAALLDRSLNELRASAAPASPRSAASTSVPQPLPGLGESLPVAPQRRVIRIQGMEGGVKEIPYGPQRPVQPPQ